MTFSRKPEAVRAGRRVCLIIAAATALGQAESLWAGVAFDPSTSKLTITHDANLNDPNDTVVTKNPSLVPPSGSLFPVNNYQMNHTFTINGTNDSGLPIQS